MQCDNCLFSEKFNYIIIIIYKFHQDNQWTQCMRIYVWYYLHYRGNITLLQLLHWTLMYIKLKFYSTLCYHTLTHTWVGHLTYVPYPWPQNTNPTPLFIFVAIATWCENICVLSVHTHTKKHTKRKWDNVTFALVWFVCSSPFKGCVRVCCVRYMSYLISLTGWLITFHQYPSTCLSVGEKHDMGGGRAQKQIGSFSHWSGKGQSVFPIRESSHIITQFVSRIKCLSLLIPSKWHSTLQRDSDSCDCQFLCLHAYYISLHVDIEMFCIWVGPCKHFTPFTTAGIWKTQIY